MQLTSVLRGTHVNTALLTHLKVPCNRHDAFAESLGPAISPGALRILTTPNAGGNSVSSEALSFEFFHHLCGADLLLTETECTYRPSGSPMADYVALLPAPSLPSRRRVLGVSVTRAVLKPGTTGWLNAWSTTHHRVAVPRL